ncbi:MAG: SAM-dependent methyltransferase [Campylobacterota bacterium]|nr:SAM-dependent methyltransferase [Campylobacterota bacterium]
MKLENIVPWGRNLTEYVAMFQLTNDDLNSKLLGCGDGPASFNTEVDLNDGSVVSVDPLYAYSKKEIMQRIDDITEEVMDHVVKNKENFIWKSITSTGMLFEMRIEAMTEFLMDYNEGKEEGRYVTGELPELSFEDEQFDLALSSHFLFLYSDHLDEAFHLQSIVEMLRVAKEVRVFPLVDLKGEKSTHVDAVMKELENLGFKATVVKTGYEFQKGANEMLKVTK